MRKVICFSLFLVFLAGCGQPVCVGGIGNCQFKSSSNLNNQSSGGKLTLKADTTEMKTTDRREIAITGGAAGDVTLTITQGGGDFTGSITQGKASSGAKVVYVPPSSVASGGISITIVARDSQYIDDASDPDHYHWTTLTFRVTN